jgi:hypothetical protein
MHQRVHDKIPGLSTSIPTFQELPGTMKRVGVQEAACLVVALEPVCIADWQKHGVFTSVDRRRAPTNGGGEYVKLV